MNEKDNKYESALYTVPQPAAAAAAVDGRDARLSPRWSPDGEWIAFRAGRQRRTDAAAADLPAAEPGGEARALTDLPKGAGAPVWSPDGKTIAFSSTTVADDMKKPDPAAKPERQVGREGRVARRVSRERQSDLRGRRPPRPHLDGAAAERRPRRQTPRQGITSGEFDERGLQWSPDGRRSTSRRIARPTRTTTERCGSLQRPGSRRRDHEDREHRRPDRLDRRLARREEDRVCRHAERAAGSLLQPAGPLGR